MPWHDDREREGLTEAHDPSGQLYGEGTIESFLAGIEPDEIDLVPRLVHQIRAFEAGHPAFDDMAAILLSLGPAGAAGAALNRFKTGAAIRT
jgi:sigma-B regulation protein RsbU (phosphoserine phosphatase)